MNKKSFWQRKPVEGLCLAVSSLGALGLFRQPYSTMVTAILAAGYLLILFSFFLHLKEERPPLRFRPGAFFLALSFALTGFLLFPENMAYTKSLSRAAEALHLPYLTYGRICAGVQILIGFYAFYLLGFWMEENICRLLSLPLEREEKLPLFNLILPLSSAGFFAMEPEFSRELLSCGVVAAAIALTVCLHLPDLFSWTYEKRGSRRLLSLGTALGIVLFRAAEADTGLFSAAAAVLSLPFLFTALLAFYSWLDSVLEKNEIFSSVSSREKVCYLLLFLIIFVLVGITFFKTDAFYGTSHEFDVIYTADSPLLVQKNAYLSLRHQENDLRQPLFAVFSAPFLGLPYLLSRFLPYSRVLRPLLLDGAQILLLLLSNFLLSGMLGLSGKKRVLFMGFTALTYPCLLFYFMMEQYIVAYFWVILTLCLLLKDRRQAELPLCGAGGTLLTGMILMPALGENHPLKEFKPWFFRMLTLCLSFLILLLGFGRLDTILEAPTQLLTMLQFSGKSMTPLQKLWQYSGFFRQALIFPEAGADLIAMGYPSWQLALPTGFSLPGLTILGLCILSIFLNRKDAAARAAGLWLGFSFLVLFLLGWGTQENGLVLYSLYFGWAVWALLLKLLGKLQEKLPHAGLVLGIAGILLLAYWNIPAIYRLISFGLTYYPI